MILPFKRFSVGSALSLPQDLNANFDAINQSLLVRTFVDATAGSVVYNLPNGAINPTKDYQYVKTDVSANTVTITAFGTQTINGSTSYVLASQYNFVNLSWNPATQGWLVTSFG